jgi:mono/diheme cytochrome c family protein
MKKGLKWIGIVVGGLLGLLVLVIIAANVLAAARMNRQYDVAAQMVPIPSDEASLARGKHLVEVVSTCSGCHGPDLSGTSFLDDPAIGSLAASNLTSGRGGVGTFYTDADWVRALTHGVAPDGRMLLIMPSQNFRHYSDEDLGAMIAYLKSVPPVDREFPDRRLSLMGSTFFGLGFFGQVPAEMIDHAGRRPAAPPSGATVEYGAHLVTVSSCRDCHAENLAGGSPAPGEPWGSNLTPGGNLGSWSEAEFITSIRTGMTPSGRALIPNMPWQAYRHMTDEELQAIYRYLSSLDPLPENTR